MKYLKEPFDHRVIFNNCLSKIGNFPFKNLSEMNKKVFNFTKQIEDRLFNAIYLNDFL